MIPTFAALQAAPAGGGAGPSGGTIFLIQIVLIFGIFYFLMIRPQQKQRQRHEEGLRNIKKGDEIVTAGGIIGRVVHIRELPKAEGAKSTGLDDQVTIQSGESRLVIERGKIARITAGVSASA
jgi:preprotein translocase subunit YajC